MFSDLSVVGVVVGYRVQMQGMDMTPRVDLMSRQSLPRPGSLGIHSGEQRPGALLLDKDGRMLDATGKEVKMVRRAPEFKANIAKEKVDLAKAASGDGVTDEAGPSAMIYDERLADAPKSRGKRGLKFHDQGNFVALANKQRAKAQLEKLSAEIAAASKKTGISSATKLALIAPFKNDTEDLVVPDVEWWDALILTDRSYNQIGTEGTFMPFAREDQYSQYRVDNGVL